MEIELAMKVLQMAMPIDKTRQDALAPDINDLGVGGDGDFAAPADCLKPACLDHDDGILERRPSGTVDQFSTLHDKYFFCHFFFPFFDEPLNFKLKRASQP
jgi:hypothetical protein